MSTSPKHGLATTSATTAPIYLHIVSAKDADRLVGVETAIAKSVELRDDSLPAGTAARDAQPPRSTHARRGDLHLGPGGRYFNLVDGRRRSRKATAFSSR